MSQESLQEMNQSDLRDLNELVETMKESLHLQDMINSKSREVSEDSGEIQPFADQLKDGKEI